jgi:hypothetical protein
VATLVDEALPPGRHELTWRGRGDDGRTLPSGTYLLRVAAAGETRTGKLTILK